MANSTKVSKASGDKRERLVASAGELMHHHGVQATTLAEVAEAAEVPLGNVYYYFKTRDELVEAVIGAQAERVRSLLDRLESRRSPRAKLKGLVESWADAGEMVAAHGCPVGSLCSELAKSGDGLGREAEALMEMIVEWAGSQFRELGLRNSRELALTLLAGVQGAALVANTMRDPGILTDQVRRLDRWVDSLG